MGFSVFSYLKTSQKPQRRKCQQQQQRQHKKLQQQQQRQQKPEQQQQQQQQQLKTAQHQRVQKLKQQLKHEHCCCLSTTKTKATDTSCNDRDFLHDAPTTTVITNHATTTNIKHARSTAACNISLLQQGATKGTTTNTTTKTLSWLLAAFLLTLTFIAPTQAAKPRAATATTSTRTTTPAAATTITTTTTAAGTAAAAAAATITATLEPPLAYEANDDDDNDDGAAAAVAGLYVLVGSEELNEQDNNKHNNDNDNNNNNVPSSNEQQLLQFYQQAQHRHRQRDKPIARDSIDDTLPTVAIDSLPTAASLTAASSSTSSTTTSAATTATTLLTTEAAKCEPKVLEEIPTEPFYDFTDITEDAARQFTEFLGTKFSAASLPTSQSISEQLKEELRRRANGIASYAISQDDSLLAFAIAAPTVDTVVVKFKDNVTIPPEKHSKSSFLGSYWRELGLAWNSTDGAQEWGAPFRDCNALKGRWLWPFRISFTEFKIKIVAAAFIAADEDLCNDGLEEIFGRRHGCDRNTSFCLLTESKPFAARDAYTCICHESFYLPNSTLQGFPGDVVELSEGFDNYSCVPCPGGCSSCDQYGVCLFGEEQELVSMENLLRVSVGSVLGACMLCCIVMAVIVFRQRKCKAIASGMWTVLETILLGIVLLYASVAVHFFPASTERCLIEPWLRELGFITCYGAIILKLYRHLVEFRTRKAHRWVLRDVDLLKYLGTMVFAVICYMAAFTASSLDLIETAQLESLREVRTNTCHPLKWELVTQVSEVLILCFGLHLALASRNANTQFRERQFLVASLTLEFLVSSSYYILRLIYLPELSPGAILLALFLRSQLTNTVSLGLIFVPKLWFQHKQVRSLAYDLSIRLPVDAFKGSHDVGHHLGGGYAGLCLGDPDIGELTISEMTPEDIRAELKRLYTQLEILKNKTIRQDNPHISKRRGGRKAGHRRFSLQALSAKHRSNKHHQDVEITEAEPSRTPEDSVCSAEGPTDTYAEVSGISHSMLSHSVVSHSK